MTANIVFFPVGNGDMTLLTTESGKTILIDVNIREKGSDPDDETPNVLEMLKQQLKQDGYGRLYVDVFLLSHPDLDHCRGILKHFRLGEPDDCPDDKILISEIWSSPMVFRRASKKLTLSEDAKAFNTEAKRRVQLHKESQKIEGHGNRIQILGEDENGKTDRLGKILAKTGSFIPLVNGVPDSSLSAYLLGPLPKSETEEDEETLSKNNSSVIIHFTIEGDGKGDACSFLTGGDSEVVIWETLWDKYKNTPFLSYDILQIPHHCSWHSVSHDSWSELGGEAEVSDEARYALSQAKPGALIISSSNLIEDDDNDPPCIAAKRVYEEILESPTVTGRFYCTGSYPTEEQQDQLAFEITNAGPKLEDILDSGSPFIQVSRQPIPHG
ncbi:metallohydrolase [cf. Phormidesmis sp. LEGE 11477]|uniref:metallohydrolase n=1 Tax=cf. Phormidesmis sp. LEGE 11477 TaxID=1828680 RepID=UPI0018815F92|nr:metallohydrolase [cf. Phormidesmis sp. LEGE 11477]MBE9062382.1 metallohydrolase [cf. Phormidesmis sp. LEGE 11477]